MILGDGTTVTFTVPGPSVAMLPPLGTPAVVFVPVAGPQGPPGVGSPLTFTGTWSSFSTAHTFAYLPPVRLIDSTGEEVEIGVEYPDATHVAVTFPTPFTGTIVVG